MHQYELTAIFPQEEDQYQAGREAVLTDLAAQGAEILKTEEKGDRDLAYEINKLTDGYYVLMNFESAPDFPAELERVLSITEGVIRWLTICKDQ